MFESFVILSLKLKTGYDELQFIFAFCFQLSVLFPAFFSFWRKILDETDRQHHFESNAIMDFLYDAKVILVVIERNLMD